jgi:Ran GTPase-activating protein (RanGAP) involved in mRNA processing and transport
MEFPFTITTMYQIIPENCTSLKLVNINFKLFSEKFQQNATIHTLDASKNNFNKENVLFLNLIISKIKKLNNLILYDCSLYPFQIKDIFKSLNLSNLKEIDFYFNYVRDEGCSYISEYLKNLDCLSILDLSFCQINNLGIEHLTCGLSHHPSLKNLNLKGNLFTANGYIAIFDCLRTMKSMKYINLEDSGEMEFIIYESFFSFLLENTPLEEIDISHQYNDKNFTLLAKGVSLNENILRIGKKPLDPLERSLERNLKLKEMKLTWNWKQVRKKLLDFKFK